MKAKIKNPLLSKVFKSRTFVGTACIAAAVIIGFFIAPLASQIKTVQSPDGSQRQSHTESAETDNSYTLQDGQYILSVATKNFSDSVSGKLRNGDIVTVYIPSQSVDNAISTQAGTISAENPPELQYVKVVAVTNSSGEDITGTGSQSSGTNDQPATVTLLVNARQAQILAGAENNTVHFALAYRGGGKKAEQLLERQEEYFKTASSSQDDSSADQLSSSSKESQSVSGAVAAEVTK